MKTVGKLKGTGTIPGPESLYSKSGLPWYLGLLSVLTTATTILFVINFLGTVRTTETCSWFVRLLFLSLDTIIFQTISVGSVSQFSNVILYQNC